MEAYFCPCVPVSDPPPPCEDSGVGEEQERDEGCCGAGMTTQLALTSAHFHESPRASQEEALPLSALTRGTTGWAPALRVLDEIPTLRLM